MKTLSVVIFSLIAATVNKFDNKDGVSPKQGYGWNETQFRGRNTYTEFEKYKTDARKKLEKELSK